MEGAWQRWHGRVKDGEGRVGMEKFTRLFSLRLVNKWLASGVALSVWLRKTYR